MWRAFPLLAVVLHFLGGRALAFEVTADAFQHDGNIPILHTCDGEDISPPLRWQDVPSATKSFALIADDPDAPMGTWVHWLVYDIPASARELKAGIPPSEALSDGSRQGSTNFGRSGYGGPCPPPGKPHRYYFKLYALDTLLNLPPAQATKSELLKAMEGHVLQEAQLMGRYQRKR